MSHVQKYSIPCNHKYQLSHYSALISGFHIVSTAERVRQWKISCKIFMFIIFPAAERVEKNPQQENKSTQCEESASESDPDG